MNGDYEDDEPRIMWWPGSQTPVVPVIPHPWAPPGQAFYLAPDPPRQARVVYDPGVFTPWRRPRWWHRLFTWVRR